MTMKNLPKTSVTLLVLSLLLSAPAAAAREQIRIVGSSTVLPFARVVAELFGNGYPYKTPVVESGGSSGGLKLFCAGIGGDTIDIANTSRRIKAKELETCAANGVKRVAEVMIGYGGIVFISALSAPDYELSIPQVYLALAAEVPLGGKMTKNPYKNWKEIDENLPDSRIKFFIPGEKHGTRDVFEGKIMYSGCRALAVGEVSGSAGKELKKRCMKVRTDGVSSDIDGDYSITMMRTEQSKDSIGVLGFGSYDLNQDKLKAAVIDGKTPTLEGIAVGDWPVSRPLYFYVKLAHLKAVKGLDDYVKFFLSEEMIGEDGAAVERGLIPQSDARRKKALADFINRKNVSL